MFSVTTETLEEEARIPGKPDVALSMVGVVKTGCVCWAKESVLAVTELSGPNLPLGVGYCIQIAAVRRRIVTALRGKANFVVHVILRSSLGAHDLVWVRFDRNELPVVANNHLINHVPVPALLLNYLWYCQC